MGDYRKPLPGIDARSKPFWDGLKGGEIRLPYCVRCQTCAMQFAPWCARCGHAEFTWRAMSGHGRIWSHCAFHRAYFEGFELPYNVALVELAEGPRLISNVVGIPNDDLAIGMPVEPVFQPVTPEVTLLLFRPNGSD